MGQSKNDDNTSRKIESSKKKKKTQKKYIGSLFYNQFYRLNFMLTVQLSWFLFDAIFGKSFFIH